MKTTRSIIPTPALPFTTSRLLLRPMKAEDLNDFHVLRTDLAVMKWTSTAKIDADLQATRTWMDRFFPPNDATTFQFAIEELNTPGRVIGVVGSHTAEPPECGYMLRKDSWGKGYATEALKAWIQAWWALPRRTVDVDQGGADDGCRRITGDDGIVREVLIAGIDSNNVPSRKVLEKCGFRFFSTYDEGVTGDRVSIEYHLTRPDP